MPARAPYSPPHPEAQRRPSLAESYASLEALLRASPRGRWFLAEYASRNRSAETELLLEALARIERAVSKPAARHGAPDHVFAELLEMSEAIARTRREIAQIRPPHQFDKQLVSATAELDHIVEATEKATSDSLEAAEEIQEVAWTLREKGIEIDLCDKIDQRATDIYTACSFQDITGQRTEKVVKALRFIEQRINAMIEIWGVDDIAFKVDDIALKMRSFAETVHDETGLLHGPQDGGEGLKQADVDRMLRGAQAAAAGALEDGVAAVPSEAFPAPSGSSGFERPEPLTLAELDAVSAPPCSASSLFFLHIQHLRENLQRRRRIPLTPKGALTISGKTRVPPKRPPN
jgi:chemotaxis protein CheZ